MKNISIGKKSDAMGLPDHDLRGMSGLEDTVQIFLHMGMIIILPMERIKYIIAVP